MHAAKNIWQNEKLNMTCYFSRTSESDWFQNFEQIKSKLCRKTIM